MNTSKIIKAYIGAGTYSTTEPITQGDYGYILQIEGAVLPATYRVDFSNNRHEGEALTVYGNENGAEVPEELIATGKDIFAFYYYIEEGFGKTAYTWKIPNDTRAKYGDREPTPTQQDSIDQLIVRSNEAVETAEGKAEEASASAQSASDSAIEANRAELSAKSHASNAEQSSINADLSANDANESAEASARSANQAAQIKADVEGMAEDAQAAANSSEISARASSEFASQAQGFARQAESYANGASGYASQASESAQMASTKASEASQSTTTASQKATEASQSASQALSYKTDAESAKTASQTAQGLAESARDTAVSAKTDAESARDDAESARDEAQQAVASISGALADKAPVITDTASGAIASFTDGADDLPLKSLVVDIDPVQDLHGQDAPYPAGGGKNLFDKTATDTSNGYIARTYINGGGTSLTENYNVSEYIRIKGSTTYTLNPTTGSNPGYCFYDSSKNVISGAKYSDSVIVTFTSPSNAAYLRFSIPKANIDAIQLEEGSTATAYAPYSNICPISGWTEVDVEQRGVNIFDKATAVQDAFIDDGNGVEKVGTGSVCSDYIPVVPNATYYIKSDQTMGAWGAWYDKDKNFISGIIGYIATAQDSAKTKTAPSNARYMRLTIVRSGTGNLDTFSVNYPSTDHDYHPYTGRSITIQLGQTVYGGKLDVLSGELVIDRAMVDLGSKTFTKWVNDNNTFACPVPGISTTSQNITCNTYAPLINGGTSWGAILSYDMTIYHPLNNIYLLIRDTRYTDATVFNTSISGVQLVYPLATPITIQLTPNQVNSLLGANNIWADSGDTEVEYRADTRLYIEKLTQPEEDDMIADSAITSGQFFMIGNSLYRALANIASGATITVGTNAQRVSLSDALNLVNA